MSNSYLGSKVSLISKSNIRYEGILYSIDTKESTIALSKVRFWGTENRVCEKYVPPRDDVYDYIIFRACDIRDLIVMEPPEAINDGLDDPAIVQAQMFSSGDNELKGKPAPPEPNAYQLGAAAAAGAPVPHQPAGAPKSFNDSNPNLAGNVSDGLYNGHQANQVPTGPPSTTGPAFGFRSAGSTSPASHSPVPDQPKQDQPASGSIAGASSSSAASNNALNLQQSVQSGSQQHLQSSQPSHHHQGNRRNWQENHQFANGHPHHGPNNNQDRRPRAYQPNQPNRRQPGLFNPHHHHTQGGPNQFNQRNNPMPMFRRHPGGPMQPNGMPRPRNQPPMMRNGPHPMRPNQFNPTGVAPNNNTRGGPAGHKFDPALKIDFDFEKANLEFQELEIKLSKLIVSDKENEQVVEVEEPKKPEEAKLVDEEGNFYDKKKSFFDKISCEALERSKGNVTKVDWKQERKLNVETFGMQFNFRRNNYNSGYRPRPNYQGGGGRNNNAGNNSRFRSNSINNSGNPNTSRVNA